MGYSVDYGVQESSDTKTVYIIGNEATQTHISGLAPSSEYEVRVAAVSCLGTGVYSNSVTALTLSMSSRTSGQWPTYTQMFCLNYKEGKLSASV